MPRLILVRVGELVLNAPERASGSRKPWVMRRAFALGDPSALVDHLENEVRLQHAILISLLRITKVPHIMLKEGSQFFSFGFSEGQPVCQGHGSFIQVVLVLGFWLHIAGVSITGVVEDVVSHFPVAGQDLESRMTSPGVVELLCLQMPTIMIAGVPKEGASGFAKVFHRDGTCSLSWLEG